MFQLVLLFILLVLQIQILFVFFGVNSHQVQILPESAVLHSSPVHLIHVDWQFRRHEGLEGNWVNFYVFVIILKELFHRNAVVEVLDIVTIQGDISIFGGYKEKVPVLRELAFSRNHTERRMSQMNSPFLEDVHHRVQVYVGKDYFPVGVSDQHDIWIKRVEF